MEYNRMSLISSSQKPLLLLLDCFTYILEGKMFNLSFPPPDILGKEKRRNIQHQIYLSSPSVSSMFSLATKPLSDNRPRLISGLSQKEELPDLLSLSLCHVASHLESRIDARKRHILLVFKRLRFEMKAFLLLIVFSVDVLNYFSLVSTLSFTLPPGQEKCLREEVHKDVLVTGEYKLSEAPHQKTHLTVSICF